MSGGALLKQPVPEGHLQGGAGPVSLPGLPDREDHGSPAAGHGGRVPVAADATVGEGADVHAGEGQDEHPRAVRVRSFQKGAPQFTGGCGKGYESPWP